MEMKLHCPESQRGKLVQPVFEQDILTPQAHGGWDVQRGCRGLEGA